MHIVWYAVVENLSCPVAIDGKWLPRQSRGTSSKKSTRSPLEVKEKEDHRNRHKTAHRQNRSQETVSTSFKQALHHVRVDKCVGRNAKLTLLVPQTVFQLVGASNRDNTFKYCQTCSLTRKASAHNRSFD